MSNENNQDDQSLSNRISNEIPTSLNVPVDVLMLFYKTISKWNSKTGPECELVDKLRAIRDQRLAIWKNDCSVLFKLLLSVFSDINNDKHSAIASLKLDVDLNDTMDEYKRLHSIYKSNKTTFVTNIRIPPEPSQFDSLEMRIEVCPAFYKAFAEGETALDDLGILKNMITGVSNRIEHRVLHHVLMVIEHLCKINPIIGISGPKSTNRVMEADSTDLSDEPRLFVLKVEGRQGSSILELATLAMSSKEMPLISSIFLNNKNPDQEFVMVA
jgi:hypothetical protein